MKLKVLGFEILEDKWKLPFDYSAETPKSKLNITLDGNQYVSEDAKKVRHAVLNRDLKLSVSDKKALDSISIKLTL